VIQLILHADISYNTTNVEDSPALIGEITTGMYVKVYCNFVEKKHKHLH